MELALVHDMPECIVGDITPRCGIPIDEKHRREDEAMKQLAHLVGSRGNYLYQLYKVIIINCYLLLQYLYY